MESSRFLTILKVGLESSRFLTILKVGRESFRFLTVRKVSRECICRRKDVSANNRYKLAAIFIVFPGFYLTRTSRNQNFARMRKISLLSA